MAEVETKSLPENAYQPLKDGEIYMPLVPASMAPPEVTWRAVLWGTLLCIVFSVASAYSALKVGQGMEAAIPISILAIGLARVYRRRSTVLENVIITSMGGASAAVVSGAVFTVPALYALHLDPHPVQTIFICLAGGCLGILFLIPLRRYFVREMHGKFPFPEATAITEVLVTGEKGGSQARLLLQATAIAAVYDFFVTTFHVWKEYLNFQFVPAVRSLAEHGRMVFNFDAVSFILGLGYVMGPRIALIFCAGGILVNFVLVPMIWFIGSHMGDVTVYPATIPISHMTAAEIYRYYVRFIGVGAIASAGLVGILKSLRVVVGSFAIAMHAFRHGEAPQMERTDRDIPILAILLGVVLGAIASGRLLRTTSCFLDRGRRGPGADAALLILLHHGGCQRHCHHGEQPGQRHDFTDRHRLRGGVAEVRTLRDYRHVLRDGHGRHGLRSTVRLGPVHYRLESRLLARFHAFGAGEGEVYRGRRGGHHRRVNHHPAGQGLPVRRGRARRPTAGPGRAPGLRTESRGVGIHERPARRLYVVRHRRHDHRGAGDARPLFHGLRAGNLSAAPADHADLGRRIPLAPGEQARGESWRPAAARPSASAASLLPAA